MSTFPYGIEDSKQVGFNCGHAYIVGGRPPLAPEQQMLVAKDLAEGCCATPEAAFAFIQSFQEGYRARIEVPLERIIAKYAALLEGYRNIEDFPLEGHQIMQGVLDGPKASVPADEITYNRDVNMQHMDPEYFERVRWIWDEAIAAIHAREAYRKQSEEEGGSEAKGSSGNEPMKSQAEQKPQEPQKEDGESILAFLCPDNCPGIEFPINRWLREADERAIGALRELSYGENYLSDEVAQTVRAYDEKASAVMAYCEAVDLGYTCAVPIQKAEAWIAAHRPHLIHPTPDPQHEG